MKRAFVTTVAILYAVSAKPHNGIFTGSEKVIRSAISRIYGGEPVTSELKYSFFLSLVIDYFGFDVTICGATLIAPNVALTAAHCVTDSDDYIDDYSYYVISGVTEFPVDPNTPFERIRVVDVVVHPEFSSVSLEYDVAILHLEVESNSSVIILDDGNFIEYEDGMSVKTIGFGEADDEYGSILREVELEYVPNLLCSQLYSNVPASDIFPIHESMMCAWKYETSPCYGDSGGPIFAPISGGGRLQMGVVSWGFECGSETFPGVFARIAPAHDWITEQVDSMSSSPPSTVVPDSMTSFPSAFPLDVTTSAPSTSPSTSTSPTSTPTTSPIIDILPTSTPSTSPTTNPLDSSADSSALTGTKLFTLSFACFVNAVALLVLF